MEKKIGVFDRWSLMGGGCLQEAVAHGCSTAKNVLLKFQPVIHSEIHQ